MGLIVKDANNANRTIASYEDALAEHFYKVVSAREGPIRKPVRRYLDTVGDGTGTRSMAADHSSAAEEFYIFPATNLVFRVDAITIQVTDGAGFDPDEFGAIGAALTNGIKIEVRTSPPGGSTTRKIHAEEVIKTNGDFYRIGTVQRLVGASVETIACRIQLAERISNAGATYLAVVVNDDLSALASLYAIAEGVSETETI